MNELHVQIGIIGAGPAGLLLSHLLNREGITNLVLECHSESYVRRRDRAGILDANSVEILDDAGLSENLHRKGIFHEGVYFYLGDEQHFFSLRDRWSGRTVATYSQTNLLNDLLDVDSKSSANVLFEARVKSIEGLKSKHPQISFSKDGVDSSLTCDFVIGCDGFHGISRQSIPGIQNAVYEQSLPHLLLGVLVKSAPLTENVIFSSHSEGFCVQSMRSSQLTKFYLQCDPAETPEDWSDLKVMQHIQQRMHGADIQGEIIDKNSFTLRSFVCEKMQYQKLFLAGDAAHVFPPTGAKGMNNAIADVQILAEGLHAFYQTGSELELLGYTKRCLPRVWENMRFSYWIINHFFRCNDEAPFEEQLKHSSIRSLFNSHGNAEWFMNCYTGLPR